MQFFYEYDVKKYKLEVGLIKPSETYLLPFSIYPQLPALGVASRLASRYVVYPRPPAICNTASDGVSRLKHEMVEFSCCVLVDDTNANPRKHWTQVF
jgi:hypothetical protein